LKGHPSSLQNCKRKKKAQRMESPLIQASPAVQQDDFKKVVISDEHDNQEEKQGDQPPYGVYNEIVFFFQRGIPLSLSAILEWGIPPIMAMAFSGQTNESQHLQTVLGYARVFFNVTSLMVACGGFGYLATVVPGAIGANRRDRIPIYFMRSLILSFFVMIPSFVLQFFSEPILEAANISHDVASEVGIYTKWFILVISGLIIEANFQIVFQNLLWNNLDAFVSFATGLCLDVFCSWFFILHLDLGIYGVIWTQICVKGSRVLSWLLALYPTKVNEVVLYSSTTSKEPVFNWEEIKIYLGLAIPNILNCFSGWLIFEVQILVLANINGVPDAALAAGAIWIQLETVMASIQTGWISVANLRTVYLLGQRDPNAFNAWKSACTYAIAMVGIFNVLLWVLSESVIRALSNDAEVRFWLDRFWWLLIIQSQIRVITCIVGGILNPIGLASWNTKVSWIVYYGLATPIVIFICLSDYVTSDFEWKMRACFSCSTFGMFFSTAIFLSYLLCADWNELAEVVCQRANSDETNATSPAFSSAVLTSSPGPPSIYSSPVGGVA